MDKDGEDMARMGNARGELENARRLLVLCFFMLLQAQRILQEPSDPSSLDEEDASASLSPSSSSSTPNSPLPVSVRPINQNYVTSSSTSPSPLSSATSAENPPIFQDNVAQEVDDANTSCIGGLLNLFIERCCRCCSPLPNH